MSWIQKLYETYENCESMAGIATNDSKATLLPICHTTQNAQIEIAIDSQGNFLRTRVIPKKETVTLIPCTEESAGRANVEAPHALCDKLQYVAGDYVLYGGKKKHYFNSYHENLSRWCASAYRHPKAEAVLKYISKGNVIKDLINANVLHIGDDGKLIEKWDKQKDEIIPDIFKIASSSDQTETFVRWKIEVPGDNQSEAWTDKSLFNSWIRYYTNLQQTRELCYVNGIEMPAARLHPMKIRNSGDKAKLISSNDSEGFTFRGRFTSASQTCGVGFEVTQKAHNALKWLISRQGYKNDTQAIVAWATNGKDVPDVTKDLLSIIGIEELAEDSVSEVFTAQTFASKFNSTLAGYRKELGNTNNIVVMALDSATTGRLSITFYREMTGSEFLDRIENWHNTCSWIHDYRSAEVDDGKNGKKVRKSIRFVGAPSPKDIAESIHGKKSEKLHNATVERLLPCIVDGKSIPRDLVESAVRRASNRVGLEPWEWNKALSIACALYRKMHEREGFMMGLDEDRKTRDYLFGRLLALAERIEQWALSESEKERPTTAARLMQRFAAHPYSTWRNIELSLTPYKARLGMKSAKMQQMISDIIAAFEPEEFINDKKLSGEFLLGYHCQREALSKQKETDKNAVQNKINE